MPNVKFLTIAFVVFFAIFLPLATSAESMTSTNYMIEAGRIGSGVISIPDATSTNYGVEISSGQESVYTPTVAAPTEGGGGDLPPTEPTEEPIEEPIEELEQYLDPDKDGDYDIFDFNILMINWGSTVSGNPADLNNDNIVDIFDFNYLMVHWTS